MLIIIPLRIITSHLSHNYFGTVPYNVQLFNNFSTSVLQNMGALREISSLIVECSAPFRATRFFAIAADISAAVEMMVF